MMRQRRRCCHPPPRDGIVPAMAKPGLRLLLLLGLGAPCMAAVLALPARAQVTVDLHALDAPPGGGPSANPPQAPAPAPVHRPVPRRLPPRRTEAKPVEKPTEHHEPTHETRPAEAKPPRTEAPAVAASPPAAPKPIPQAAPTPPEPPAAVIGNGPPPAPIIPPPAPADAPMAPAQPPTISATAGTTVAPLPPKDGDGVRLDFETGQSDLTQRTVDAVKALVAAAPKADTTTYNVMAYAAGVPQDPSTARRLSLSRALSVRSALMASGVPSAQIYVRAMGAEGGKGPPDRVDVLVMGANAAAPPPGAPSGTKPGDSGTRTP